MSREIKFKGLRKEYNSEWHESPFKYGSLLNDRSIGQVGAGLASYDWAEVLPETVGQYTGLKDKNGKDIYKGDILDSELYGLGVVQWDNELSSFTVFVHDNPEDDQYFYVKSYGKVIGNIHENPELISNN